MEKQEIIKYFKDKLKSKQVEVATENTDINFEDTESTDINNEDNDISQTITDTINEENINLEDTISKANLEVNEVNNEGDAE